MGTNANIPLEFRPPQVDPPANVLGAAMQIQGMQQMGQLRNQQIQADQLQNQERQHAIDAEKKLSDLINQNSHPGEDGQVHTDRPAVMKGMAAAGFASHANKWDAEARANETSQLSNAEKALTLHGKQVDMASQLLGGVVNLPPDTPAETVQAVYRQQHAKGLQAGLMKPGEYPDELAIGPDGKPDPKQMAMLKAHYDDAITAQQQVTNAQQAVTHLNTIATQAPKTYTEWEKAITQAGAYAGDQAHLSTARTFLVNHGAPKDLVNGILPATWTPEMQKQLKTRLLSPEHALAAPGVEAETEMKQAENAGRVLSGATTVGERNTLASALPGSLPTQYGQLDGETDAPLTDDARARDRNLSMRPSQASAAERRDRETPLQHKQYISQLADQAIAESAQGGGGSLENAIDNVSHPTFYQNHPIGDNRGEVLKELAARKTQGQRGVRTQQEIDKADEDEALSRSLYKAPVGHSAPAPTGGGRGAPGSSAKPKNTLGAAAGPAIPATPATPASAALPEGGGKSIATDRASARKFYEAAGRNAVKASQLAAQHGWKP